jgi:superfamily II DNA or RNA helicase
MGGGMKQLRPHQEQAIAMLRRSLGQGHRRPMVQAPTGFGKTVLASHIVAGARAKGNRVIFVVPALSLIDQTVAAFHADGITEVGVLQGIHEMTDRSQPIQVASIQTLMRRPIPDADIVVVDEAHRWFKFMGEWMARWDRIPFVGLSATPWTSGLGKFYDDLIIAATTQDLIDAGYLSKFRVFAPSKPDLTGVRTVAGDYHEGDLSEAMNKPPLVADLVREWKQRAEGRPTLVFGVDRAHAKAIQQDFLNAGIACGYCDAYTERADRNVLGRAFNSGELPVIANVGTLTTGIDWDVRCIVLARPTKSEILFTQIIGRGLRTASGKDDCLILDHSDTHQRLGFVTDIHHTKLSNGAEPKAKKQDEPLPKECPQCKFLRPPRVSICPACGFKPVPVSGVEHIDGELQELTATKERQAQDRANRKTPKPDKHTFLGELNFIAWERNYSSGWVANQYRNKFGVWPNAVRHDERYLPSMETRQYVKHQMIRFAKRRTAA